MSGESSIIAKLGLDTSEFKTALRGAVADAGTFSGQVVGKVGGNLAGLSRIGTVVATALGLNLQDIADKVARAVTGMSRSEEEAYKRAEQLSTEAADLAIANMRSRLSDEQKYQSALRQRDALIQRIAEADVSTGQGLAEMLERKVQLEKTSAELIAYEAKQRAVAAKEAAAELKSLATASENEFEASLSTLTTAQKIAAIKESIAATQGVITSGVLAESNLEAVTATLLDKQNLLRQQQAKLQDEAVARAKKLALSLEEELELFTLRQKSADRLTAADRDRLAILGLQKKERQAQVGIEELEEQLIVGGLTPAESKQLTVLIEQKKKLDEQIAAKTQLKQTTEELLATERSYSEQLNSEYDAMVKARDWSGTRVDISRSGTPYALQSSDALQGVLDRLRAQLAPGNPDVNQDYGRWLQNSVLNSEIRQVVKELKDRSDVLGFLSQQGESLTRREYGDDRTERALAELNRTQDASSRDLREIKTILTGLVSG